MTATSDQTAKEKKIILPVNEHLLRANMQVLGPEMAKMLEPVTSKPTEVERFPRLERNDCVAKASKTVHSEGNPMSHSTHPGFSEPPLIGTLAQELAEPSSQSRLDAVGHIPLRAITASDVHVLRGPPGIRAFIAMCAS